MAEDGTPGPDPTVAARPEDDDHDLLTYGEAGARLVETIASERQRLDDLRATAARAATAAEPAADALEAAADTPEEEALAGEVAAAEARLAALEDAKARLDQSRIDDSSFFGPGGRRRS